MTGGDEGNKRKRGRHDIREEKTWKERRGRKDENRKLKMRKEETKTGDEREAIKEIKYKRKEKENRARGNLFGSYTIQN